jgi:hypothetical protein
MKSQKVSSENWNDFVSLRSTEKKVRGLLVYQVQTCIGWIAIDPMIGLVGHDCQTSGNTNEWSIHCLFLKEVFRGKGISTRRHVNEAEFSGRRSTYSKFGFRPAGKTSDFYQRMELVERPLFVESIGLEMDSSMAGLLSFIGLNSIVTPKTTPTEFVLSGRNIRMADLCR